jgi:hypothetical protein
MNKILIVIGILVIVALAGWGTVYAVGYFNFKHLQSLCEQHLETLPSITTAYFTPSSSFSGIQSIALDIQSSQKPVSVSAVSAEQGLQQFQQTHANDAAIQNAIKELTNNPIEATIAVTFPTPIDGDAFSQYVMQEAAKYHVSVDTIKPGITQAALQQTLKSVSQYARNAGSEAVLKDCIQETAY